MTRTVCLGIDPGLASLGWGAVAREGQTLHHISDGTLHTAPTDGDDELRAADIGRRVRDLIATLSPGVVAVERWAFYPEAKANAAHSLGLVIGAVLAQVPQGTPVVLMRAVDLRTSLGLPRGASKDGVRGRVEQLLRERGRSQHSADALGVAIVGALRARATRAVAATAGGGR